MLAQELSQQDWERQRTLCQGTLHSVLPDAIVWNSDEAHFHLSGTVKKQNFRYSAPENPRELHKRPLQSPKVTVLCAISSGVNVGPCFFEEDGVTVTMTSDRYCIVAYWRTFSGPNWHNFKNKNPEHFWFSQDGAKSHITRRSHVILQGLFPGHFISLHAKLSGRLAPLI